MAAKLSDLVDKMSGVNLQMEGHVDVLSQSVKDQWESDALGSSPSPLAILVPSQEAAIQFP